MFSKRKGQVAGGLVARVMAVIVGTIMIVAVAIPVTNDVIDEANLTGTTSTIVEFIPLFLALSGLLLAASLIVSAR